MSKSTGFALEVDVLKKIEHQLGRLPSQPARERALDFVRRAVAESANGSPGSSGSTMSATSPSIDESKSANTASANQRTLDEAVDAAADFGS